jgi:hypothetical protein
MALERVLRWTLVSIAIAGLVLGIVARANGQADVADLCFTFATIPVIAGLAVSIVRDLLTFGISLRKLYKPPSTTAEGLASWFLRVPDGLSQRSHPVEPEP